MLFNLPTVDPLVPLGQQSVHPILVGQWGDVQNSRSEDSGFKGSLCSCSNEQQLQTELVKLLSLPGQWVLDVTGGKYIC